MNMIVFWPVLQLSNWINTFSGYRQDTSLQLRMTLHVPFMVKVSVLQSLHWLPIEARLKFKVLCLTYKSYHGLAPSYLSCLLSHHQSQRSLRSDNLHLLSIPHYNFTSFGDKSFCVHAPRLWNKLPLNIKLSPSFDSFRSQLKTFLFREHYDCWTMCRFEHTRVYGI